MKIPLWLALFAGSYLLAVSPVALATDTTGQCAPQVAQWLDPANGEALVAKDVFDQVSASGIVLLGEVHTNAGHHRWQHYVLAALHSRRPGLVVGLEMLPRRVQPVLDDWTAGRLDEAAFLRDSEWDELWGYDADLYLPLLRFSRQHRIPAVAINIDRSLVSRTAGEGWRAIPQDERMGLSDPAPASEDYLQSLAELYRFKQRMFHHGGADAESEPELEDILQDEAFGRFVDAQLVWDRAMAEALAEAYRIEPGLQVVGIIGRGHLEYGFGIPHQLRDLGIDDVTVLLPVDGDDDCAGLSPDLADAVFVVEVQEDAIDVAGPQLGVMIEDGETGVTVMEVVGGSVAELTGLLAGDIIARAAGFDTLTAHSLIEVIQRQAVGTWLPLEITRDGEALELIARFPQQFD